MEEGRRQPLKVVEHVSSQAEQDTLTHLGHIDELEVVGCKVDYGDAEEGEAQHMQAPHLALVHSPFDAEQQKQRYADAGYRVNKDGGHRGHRISFIWSHICDEAHDDFMVICAADNAFVCQIVHVGRVHAARGEAAHAAHHSAKSA